MGRGGLSLEAYAALAEQGFIEADAKRKTLKEHLEATPEKVGPAFKANVEAQEGKFITKLEEIYAKLSEEVLQGLRRRLPVTRQKFDWDRIAVAKLAGDLQRAVRLLQKANNLQPDDAEIMAVKARADKEMAAVLRQVEKDEAAATVTASEERDMAEYERDDAAKTLAAARAEAEATQATLSAALAKLEAGHRQALSTHDEEKEAMAAELAKAEDRAAKAKAAAIAAIGNL